ncbi:hypothetical protein NUW58_g9874 [Xylaria curta]|uniref:Uncharacterized protein n=1 Tax=Xylaria curta TaxID=42375 RepID=A0ACC1MSA7_9PEZI|nr:hypothetical protein NUW58_g9874 [Xylaria curta]
MAHLVNNVFPLHFNGVICFEDTLGCVQVRSSLSTLEVQTKTRCPPSLALVADTSLFWGKKRPLTVSFLDSCSTSSFTHEQVKDLIKASAEDWTRGTSLCFRFLDSDDPHPDRADVRISFRKNGNYSVVGTTFVEFGQPTMNLGFRGDVTETQITRGALHEFGHALGFLHEHSSPNCPLRLNREVIKKHFENRPPEGISINDFVDNNFFLKLEGERGIEASPFDEYSIMMYKIQPGWNDGGQSIGGSASLSETDMEMVRKWYPPRTIRQSSVHVSSRRSHRLEEDVQFSMNSLHLAPVTRGDGRVIVADFRCDRPECLRTQCDTCFRHTHDPERRIERYVEGYRGGS